jgi:hypothetical protein
VIHEMPGDRVVQCGVGDRCGAHAVGRSGGFTARSDVSALA